jgi:hypothetical protein
MTTVIGYSLKENKNGKKFVNLELQGDIVMVQSQESGRYYATAKKAVISSTFDEETAEQLVGKEIPGRIEKVDCLEYEFTIPSTGEVTMLSHRYEFVPEGQPIPLRVVKSLELEEAEF